MRKNLNKLILSGVIFSVFLGITGYSVGMTYGNQVAKSSMISLKSDAIKNSVKDNSVPSNNEAKQETNIGDSKSSKPEKSSLKSTVSKNTPNRRKSMYRSGRTGGYSGSSSKNSGSSAPTLSASSVSIPNKLKDGTYYGIGKGYGGNLKVKVAVLGGKITDISVVSHNETPGYYEKGAGVIGKILSAQSAGVNVVSGATYTSNGIKAAVADALKGAGLSSSEAAKVASSSEDSNLKAENEKMKKEIEKLKAQASNQVAESNISNLKDGTYEGEGKGFKGTVKVSVSVKNGKIDDIKVLGHGDDEAYFNKAVNLISDVKSKQTLKVDSVSGATFSSIGIKSAISNALKKAGMNVGDASVSEEALKAKDKEIEELKAQNEKLSDEIKEVKEAQVEKTSDINISSLKDGTYKGEGNGYKGKVKVSVTVKSGKIANISVLGNSDDQPYFRNATAVIDKVVKTQSVKVDSVSGATFSSLGIKQAIANALSQAGSPDINTQSSANSALEGKNDKDAQISKLKERVRGYRRETKELRDQLINSSQDIKDAPLRDGTYVGEGGGFRGKIKVQVSINSGNVSSINVIENVDDAPYFDKAKRLINDVINRQRVKVDSVSGATYSSLGIKQGIIDALKKSREAEAPIESNEEVSESSKTTESENSRSGSSEEATPANTDSSRNTDSSTPSSNNRKTESPQSDKSNQNGDLSKLPNKIEGISDGEFEGSGIGYNKRKPIKVKVTIKDGRISNIAIKEEHESPDFFDMVREPIPESIIENNSPEVDTVSGATMSSRGIINAVKESIKKAKESHNNASNNSVALYRNYYDERRRSGDDVVRQRI